MSSANYEHLTAALNTLLIGTFATAAACFSFVAGGKHVEAEHAPSASVEHQLTDERNQAFIASGAFLASTIGTSGLIIFRRRKS